MAGPPCQTVNQKTITAMSIDRSGLTSYILTSWQEIEDISGEWNRLLERSDADSIFLHWEWISTWRSVTPVEISVYCVIVRNGGGDLVAIFPLYFKAYRYLGILNIRVLCPLADSNSGSEYPDIIVDREYCPSAYHAIFEAIAGSSCEWDIIWMPRRSSWHGDSLGHIKQACRDHQFEFKTQEHIFSYIDLPNNFESFLGKMSRKRRQHRKGYCKKIFCENAAEYVTCSREEDIDDFVNALFELHEKRWLTKGHRGCFARYPAMRRFYREFTPIAAKQGWLSMSAVKQGDEFKAVQIGYIYNNTYHALQEGFDTEYISGVGEALRLEKIRSLIEMGITTYDFLGEQTQHKSSWTAKQRKGNDIVIYNRLISRIKAYILRNWATIRYLSRKLKNNDALCCRDP